MVSYIQKLLFQHDCVVIPGLGAFIGNYQPSKVKLLESKIYPPRKAIAFNRVLKNNDGLLISTIAQQESISYKEAEEKANAFVQSCLSGLEKNKSYLFTDIGRLFFDNENNLLFEPSETVNYLIQSSGLPSVQIQPIERLKTSIEDIRPKIENDKDVEKLLSEIESSQKRINRKSNVFYWVTFVLAIGLLSAVTGVSLSQGNFSHISQSSFFPDFDSLMGREEVHPSKQAEQPKAEITQPAVQEVISPVVEATTPAASTETISPSPALTQPVIEEKPATVVNIPKAYIVVGAFFDQQYADKTIAEAFEKGYHAIQVDEYNGTLHRVMIESDIQQVQTDLVAIKSSMNSRAWVFCTNCSQ